MGEILTSFSIILQFFAAAVGLRLAWTTRRTAWLPLSLAILLMGIRRSYSLYDALAFDNPINTGAETIALVISLLMLLGLVGLHRWRKPTIAASEEVSRKLNLGSILGLQRLTYTAIFLGIAAMLGCGVVGFYAFRISRNSILQSELENNLRQARELGVHAQQSTGPNAQQDAVEIIKAIWKKTEKRYSGTFVCMVSSDGRLILHTANPKKVGLDISSFSLIPSSAGNGPKNLSVLIEQKQDWTGLYTTPAGEQQIASFTYLHKLNALLAVHVPKTEVEARLRSNLLPWVTGLTIIGFVLVPLSLGLLDWAYHSSLTARRQAEEALSESEKRYRTIVENQTELVCRNLPDGTLTFVNQAYCRYFGKSYDELVGSLFIPLIPHRDKKKITQHFASLSKNNPVASHEHRVIRADGETRWHRWTNRASFNDAGEIVEIQGTGVDITDRKLAELELRESQRRFQTLADDSPSILFEADAEGKSIYANPRWSEVSGLPEGQWLGDGWAAGVHPEDREDAFQSWQYAIENGRPWQHDFRFQHINGAVTWVSGRATPLYDDDSLITGFIGECHDITERKREEHFREGRNRVLEQLAAGVSLEKVLTTLVETVEQTNPDMLCSVLLLDGNQLRHGAAPSLPDFYNEAIDGVEIGEGVGSCGASAAVGYRVIVEDIESHPNWENYRTIARKANLRACWSEPIRSANDIIVGTFAMYYRQPRKPDEADLDLIKASADVAGIAIERHRAEAALRQSEQRFDLAAKGSNDGLWDWDVLTGKVWWSARFFELLEYEDEEMEITSQLSEELIHPEDRERILEAVRAHLEDHQPYDVEFQLRTKSGRYRWFHARGQALRDLNNKPIRMSGSAQDITLRKQLENDRKSLLKRTRRQQAAVVKLASRHSAEGEDFLTAIQAITEKTCEAMEVERSSVWLFRSSWKELHCLDLFQQTKGVHSADTVLHANDYPNYFAALESGRAIDAHDANNDTRTSEFSDGYLTAQKITSMLDAAIRVSGEVIGVVCQEHVGAIRTWTPDETTFAGAIADQVAQIFVERQRQQAENLRQESERRIRLLLDSTAEAIYGLDLDGNCTFCNSACIGILGYENQDQLLGKNMHDLIHHTLIDGTPYPMSQCGIYEAFRRGEGTHADNEVLWRSDGTSFPAEYWSYPIHRDGQIEGSVVTFLDITQRKQTEEQLRQQEHQLAHVGRLHTLGEMVAGIAHEINQPLHAISSFALANVKALESNRDDGPQDALEWSQDIAQQADRAGEIIRRLRDFSMASPLDRSPLDLNQVVLEAIELVASEARHGGVQIHQQFAASLPKVSADQIQIQQVLVNLLKNAIDAMRDNNGKPRQITVQTSVEGHSIQVAVRDMGSGLPQQSQGKLFDAFFTTKPEGMGMGLAISRRIVESFGGRIEAEENSDGGATFSFLLPISTEK